MIYWLNGAYGVGKSTVTEHLKPLLRNAHVYDPEVTGNAIRDSYPDTLFRDTFEQYPLWLEVNYRILKDLAVRHDGDIIAPMTLLREESYEVIIRRLTDDGVAVRYIFLDADAETLRYRMVDLGREEPDSWCVGHIPACLRAQEADRRAVHINTVGRTPEEIASEIAALR
ncbi:MAG: AAA family ATPase [Oscillospiraceae bacterium]|nr:AAA family ATPase [Oscillospiraceae bacterium]